MSGATGYDELVGMIRTAAERVRANVETLSKLDSVGGDGDHGTTMARAMGKAEQAIADAASRQPKGLLTDVGWAIMGVDGGATGPLLGTLFMGMADAVPDAGSLDARGLAAAFEAGLAALEKQTRARVGDKTMMDALIPAVEAARKAADAGQGPVEVLAQAAQAAKTGAESTKELQAKFGRASNVGAKSIGTPDAGATSVSLVFQGFAEGAAN